MKRIVMCSVILFLGVLMAGGVLAEQPSDSPKRVSPFENTEQGPQMVRPPLQMAPSATATMINVPADSATIQLAIDGANSGDTIVVAAGTYAEAILIDGKNLTIQGAGTGSSIITGNVATTTQYIVKMDNSAVVDLSGFTIDGTGKNIQYGIFAFTGVDGDIHDNEVKNILWPGAGGLAIRRQECYIDVTNNDVYGFGRIGIYTRDDVIGNTDTGVISGNTVTALAGLDPDRLSYGISVYSGNPTVTNNDIYDCISGANVSAWLSAGLDVWTGSTSVISNNTFDNCEYGIVSNSASPVLSGNTFTNISGENVRLDYMVKGNPTPHWAEYYDTIQQGIDAVPVTSYTCLVWVGIYSGGGTYAEALNVNKTCRIYGDTRATVLVNAVGYAVNNAGIYVNADDVVISGLTLVGSNTNSLPRYGIKFADNDGCYLDDVEVRNVFVTGVDILGATNLSVSNVELKDNGGNGMQAVDARDVTFTDITTSGNAWGGVGIFTWGQYTPLGTWGIVFSGTNSIGEVSPVGQIYFEEGNYSDPPNPEPITYSTNILDAADVTIQLTYVTHAVDGNSDNANNYTIFYASLSDAQTAASGFMGHITDERYITELAGTNLYVPSYQGGIQAAVDAANPGDVVHVDAGTFDERVIVNKALTLLGATNGVGKKGFVVPSGYAYDSMTQSIIKPSTDVNQPVVQILADDVVLDGFVVANEVCGVSGSRDLVSIHYGYDAMTGIRILNNVLGPNTNTALQDGTMSRSGLVVVGPRQNPLKLTVRENKIFDAKGNGCGIMIVGPYGPTYHGVTHSNLFSGSVIEDNEITGNHRSGIELAGGVQGGSALVDHFMIRNNLITSNGWFSLADKDNLKYGHGIMFIRGGSDRGNSDANGSRYISIENNVVTGNEKSGYYFGPKNSDIFSNNNTVENNGLGTGGYSLWDGVRVDLDESYYSTGTYTDYSFLTNIPFLRNSISGNGSFGFTVVQTPTLGPVDASWNWWGDASGPQHPTSNPGGLANDVSDNVLFVPWMTGLNEISVVPSYGVTNCTTNIVYTFHIERAGTAVEARGYDVTFQIDPSVVTIAGVGVPPGSLGDVTELSYLSDVNGTTFYAIDKGAGLYTVSCAILGGSVGATGAGDLFGVEFTPVAEGTSDIDITTLKLRDVNNVPLSVGGVDGEVQIDCTVPTMDAIVEAEGECYKDSPTFATFTFRDDVNLDLAEYQIDVLGWTTIFSGVDATVWSDPGWALPGFSGLGEGTHTVYFRVKDDAGNWNGEGAPAPDTYTWSFIKDTVPPAAPTDFTAAPGYDKVHLTWTNPTGDASFVGMEIRVVGWGDYPQYGTPGPAAPSYPANETEGALVTQTALEAWDDDRRTPQDIYYYAAFAYDCAGNYSAWTSTSRDRSTSYWLGDIDPVMSGDGNIQLADLARFSVTFGVLQGGTGWNAEGDFGPTDDYSRFGIPLPDDVVDFEDLMILAMNYANVTPLGTSENPLIAGSDRVPLGDQVAFRLVALERQGDRVTYAVMIDNEAKVLKGFSLDISYGLGNELVEVKAAGALTGKASEHFFGTIEREMGKVEICVAALGVNTPFEYTGEVARVVVRESGTTQATLSKADLRDLENRRDEVALGDGRDTPYLPSVSGLMQNHPNPFNPTTTITYDVASSGYVTIEIYDVSGRLVRRLVNTHKDMGRYQVSWNGRDMNGSSVHTGVYFYRMSAPGFTSPAKKMLLLK